MQPQTKVCPKCEDKGRIYERVPGGWAIGQCDCRPPEYWKKRSEEMMKRFDKRLKEAEERFRKKRG